MDIVHHGAKTGVTGSCHQLILGQDSVLIDCGLFQGEEAQGSLDIDFDVKNIKALFLTHSHIDHIGRLPWLLAAGFKGPIYTTQATAALVPMMIEDGLKVHLNLGKPECEKVVGLIQKQLHPVPYKSWVEIFLSTGEKLKTRFQPAGHILGSAYIEILLPTNEIIVFSGDLGPNHTPLLMDPVAPERVHTLIIESTYGDKKDHYVENRQQVLQDIVERSLQDGGAILIPAFSVGRTQELLFDLENILATLFINKENNGKKAQASKALWQNLPVILDSPLALKVTEQYRHFHQFWSEEAKLRREQSRHPLAFDQCIMIENHKEHLALVNRIQVSGEPAIIIAASGMCTGGRILDYLYALLPDPRTDVIFAGFQAAGTLGCTLIDGDKNVLIRDELINVKAKIHPMSGYSAHAAQADLVSFVENIKQGPEVIRIVHGTLKAQKALAAVLQSIRPKAEIIVAAIE